jgi:SAM-dependent methyltransferase
MNDRCAGYWNAISDTYQKVTEITTDDFHYGPLIPGDSDLKLLPCELNGLRCLEMGCGAAQNSIYLAKNGAECTAFDISEKQLEYADMLMRNEGVDVKLINTSMDRPEGISGNFDLIHSVFAVGFSVNPAEVVRFAAAHLTPGGRVIISTGHPLSQCELLDLDNDQGVFIGSYFDVPPDIRYGGDGKEEIRSNFYTLSETASWFTDAGLHIDKILEPRAEPELYGKAPYRSVDWLEYAAVFARVPAAVIFSACSCRKEILSGRDKAEGVWPVEYKR